MSETNGGDNNMAAFITAFQQAFGAEGLNIITYAVMAVVISLGFAVLGRFVFRRR